MRLVQDDNIPRTLLTRSSIMTRDHAVLTEILQDAQRIYTKAQQNKITIYVSDSRYVICHSNQASCGLTEHIFIHSTDGWRELAKRPKRPLHSIILDPGITELVLEDVRDFLGNKWWYAERGIPFRRGYLLVCVLPLFLLEVGRSPCY